LPEAAWGEAGIDHPESPINAVPRFILHVFRMRHSRVSIDVSSVFF
jgi:hypothetical protein